MSGTKGVSGGFPSTTVRRHTSTTKGAHNAGDVLVYTSPVLTARMQTFQVRNTGMRPFQLHTNWGARELLR
jgi:hypothetical protein